MYIVCMQVSLIPGLPHFWSLVCEYNTWKWKSGEKWGGRGEGGVCITIMYQTSASSAPLLSKTPDIDKIANIPLTGEKLLHAHILVIGHQPFPPCQPDIIHVVSVPKDAFPIFLPLFHFHVLYRMQTEEQKTGEAWEQAYKQVTTGVDLGTLTGASSSCSAVRWAESFRRVVERNSFNASLSSSNPQNSANQSNCTAQVITRLRTRT